MCIIIHAKKKNTLYITDYDFIITFIFSNSNFIKQIYLYLYKPNQWISLFPRGPGPLAGTQKIIIIKIKKKNQSQDAKLVQIRLVSILLSYYRDSSAVESIEYFMLISVAVIISDFKLWQQKTLLNKWDSLDPTTSWW